MTEGRREAPARQQQNQTYNRSPESGGLHHPPPRVGTSVPTRTDTGT